MPTLNLPAGYTAWGGNAPTAARSADGAIFWGLNARHGGALSYAVFRQDGDETATPVALGGVIAGQGSLSIQPNGELWAVGLAAQGDGSPTVAYIVPGFVAPAPMRGADGKSVRNGKGAPALTFGLLGDFYLDTDATRLYGPKTTAGWGAGVSLIGPAGGGDAAQTKLDAIRAIVEA